MFWLLQVWTWGEPWGEFSMQLDRSPRPVPDATDVAKIACGAFHNLALTRCPSLAVQCDHTNPKTGRQRLHVLGRIAFLMAYSLS